MCSGRKATILVAMAAARRTRILLFLCTLAFPARGGLGRLNDHVSDYESLNLQATSLAFNQQKLAAHFNFTAHEREFHFTLKTHPTLFHPDFSLVLVGKEGTVRKRPSTSHFVIGSIEGEKNSMVYGRVVGNSFDGVIRTTRETYHVDPLHHHPRVATDPRVSSTHNRVIYRDSDVEYAKVFSQCQSGNSPRLRFIQNTASSACNDQSDGLSNTLRRKRQSTNLNTCSIKIVADHEFYTNVGGGLEKNTLDEMVQHILNADNIYRETTFRGNAGDIPGSRLSISSSMIFTDPTSSNPFYGDFSVGELLEAFSAEELNLDSVCLGHLFTYRDFQGTIGLAYLGDPDGQLAGGICQKRTRTAVGEANLNTGLTSLLNFGQKLSRAVSYITVAHEIGHNHGAEHDPAGECFDGKYIMYPYATSGNNHIFSDCSESFIGRTIEARGNCFTQYPSGAECGNGIIEQGEECDCGHLEDEEACFREDPCCRTNCTLIEGASCSSKASTCCGRESCQPLNDINVLCLKGDSDLNDGGCQKDTFCAIGEKDCPMPMLEDDGVPCNNGSNVCDNGACTGSSCLLFQAEPCYCVEKEELCHVCCLFEGTCTSTFERGAGIYVAPNYPCNNFTGYCTEEHVCKSVDNDDLLNNLKDILFNFASIGKWLKGNWYYVLAGSAAVVILIILLQVTYRRKKIGADGQPKGRNRGQRTRGGVYTTLDRQEHNITS